MRRDDFKLAAPPPDDRPGDRWICGRRGQPACSLGPDARGNCPQHDACRPCRSWHGRRKQISTLVIGAIIVVVLLISNTQTSSTVFKPGDLSSPHAQILSSTLNEQRCAACHPQAALSGTTWLAQAGTEHPSVTQGDRCLDCHHRTMDRSTAKFAHNLAPDLRAKMSFAASRSDREPAARDLLFRIQQHLPGPAVDMNNVQCGSCHREHQGSSGDLLDVSNTQCQTCHQKRFGTFAHSHPDFGRWPYEEPRSIRFDHSSHANVHYLASDGLDTIQEFRCGDCHPRGTGRNGEASIATTVNYQQACGRCHESTLAVETSVGFDLLTLPILPEERLAESPDLSDWPEAATGFLDGRIGPLAGLLISADPSIRQALQRIPQRDFARLDASDPSALSAAEQVAVAHRRLLEEFATRGQSAIHDRMNQLGVSERALRPLIRSISPQLLRRTLEQWFHDRLPEQANDGSLELERLRQPVPQARPTSDDRLLEEDAEGQDLLGQDLLGQDLLGQDLLGQGDALLSESHDRLETDLLAEDPLGSDAGVDPLSVNPGTEEALIADADDSREEPTAKERFDAERMLPAGGWYVDDTTLAIRYRGAGHDDLVLKSIVELAAELPPENNYRSELLNIPSLKSCLQCHAGILEGAGWKASRPSLRGESLTHFSHQPHLNIAQLSDCSYCHQVRPQASVDPVVGIAGDSISAPIHDFAPIERQDCATCHVPAAAGDNCTTCHRYHSNW